MSREKKHFLFDCVFFAVSFDRVNLKRLVEVARTELQDLGLDRLPDGRTNQRLDERVVRFLRQAGVVSPPEGHGPGAVWGELHHEQVLTCRALQMKGATLAEVVETLRGKDGRALRGLRARVLEELHSPTAPKPPRSCASWRIGEEFILVSTSGRCPSDAVLIELKNTLYSSSS